MSFRARCIAIMLALLIAAPAFAAITVREGAPAGFEQLAEPQATRVTLLYGGEILGLFDAHFTPTILTFDNPSLIADAVPSIADRPTIIKALSAPLAHHAAEACGRRATLDCGKLTPDIAEVIFTPSALTAELFINPHYLTTNDNSGPRYLPLPKREQSSIMNFNGAINGTSEAQTNYALSNQSTFAFGEGRLTTQSTVTNQGLRFDTAAASIDRNGWQAEGGLFRSRALQLVPDRDIAGVSFGSSLNTRLDAQKITGNDIILFLPRRAIVSVYRDNRLYSSRAYEAGNQSIDTTELPEGAYTIKLVIQETDGATREETRFFAKSPDIPPPDAPTYYLQAGVLRAPLGEDNTLPKIGDTPLLRGGYIARIAPNIGASIDGLWLDDRAIAEVGSFLIQGGTQLRATALASSRADVGAQFSYLRNEERWSVALDTRALWNSQPLILQGGNALIDYRQTTASITYAATPDITLGARASLNHSNGMTQESYGPNLNWYLWREGENMLSFDADITRTNDAFASSGFLRLTMRFGDYGVSGNTGYAGGEGAGGLTAGARAWYDHSTPNNGILVGATTQADRNADTFSVDGDWRNSFGRARGIVQQSFGNTDVSSYSGNFSFNTAQIGSDVYLGGDHNDMSAVVVSLSGDAAATMTIMVGGMARGEVAPGGTQTVYLAPYQRYQIRLVPAHKSLVTYDTAARSVTLYPGNVVRLGWEVNNVYIVLAKLVTPNGEPIVGAVLQEDGGHATTNAKGRLQVQLTHPERLTFITTDDAACETVLPPNPGVNGILTYKQPLVCESIPLS